MRHRASSFPLLSEHKPNNTRTFHRETTWPPQPSWFIFHEFWAHFRLHAISIEFMASRVHSVYFFVIEEKAHRSPFAIIIVPSNRLRSICYNVFIAMICQIINSVVVQPSLNNFIGLWLLTAIKWLFNWESLRLLHKQDRVKVIQSIP